MFCNYIICRNSNDQQQSVDRHVAPLGHVIMIPSRPVFTISPYCCLQQIPILYSLALSNTHSSTQQYFRYMVAVIIKFCNYIICRNSNDQYFHWNNWMFHYSNYNFRCFCTLWIHRACRPYTCIYIYLCLKWTIWLQCHYRHISIFMTSYLRKLTSHCCECNLHKLHQNNKNI
jgi:hypothetical protein